MFVANKKKRLKIEKLIVVVLLSLFRIIKNSEANIRILFRIIQNNKKKYLINNTIKNLSENITNLEKLYDKIKNNFNITEFQNYESELELIN